ncbi:hypothetical protein SDC9_160222 [bioreactor metagenome]|uniref:Uncharacterized protein n=1 Tax=bioreactor metagenome TaxID=1076179 RepID=A0A645FHB3_9ZZZZ
MEMAEVFNCTLGSDFMTFPSLSILILSYPTNSFRLSIISGVMLSIFLNPNPQALISGEAVISNLPSDIRETSMALLNTSIKSESGFTGMLLFILVMIVFSLKGFKDSSNLSNSARISLSNDLS